MLSNVGGAGTGAGVAIGAGGRCFEVSGSGGRAGAQASVNSAPAAVRAARESRTSGRGPTTAEVIARLTHRLKLEGSLGASSNAARP
jgi:hypothetical protein